MLAVYERPYAPTHPVLCLDERPQPLRTATRPPVPRAPGRAARRESASARQGTATVFLFCEPLAARRLADQLARQSTPQHGSGLNLAAIARSGRGRPWRDRRLPARATLQAEGAAWPARRDAAGGRVAWRFPSEKAPLQLKRLDPSLHG